MKAFAMVWRKKQAGNGIETGRHAAPFMLLDDQVYYNGNRTYVMADDDGQIIGTHLFQLFWITPWCWPEHACLKTLAVA